MKIEVENLDREEKEEKPSATESSEKEIFKKESFPEIAEIGKEQTETAESRQEDLKKETALLWEKKGSLDRTKEFGGREGIDVSDTVKKIEAEIEDIKRWIRELSFDSEKSANSFILDSLEASGINKHFNGLRADLGMENGESAEEDPILHIQEIRRTLNSLEESLPASSEDRSEIPYALKSISEAAKDIAEEVRSLEGDGSCDGIFDDAASWLMSLAELAEQKARLLEEGSQEIETKG